MILLELLGLLLVLTFLTFPIWVNWKQMKEWNWEDWKEYIFIDKEYKSIPIPQEDLVKICSQTQPFMVTEQYGILCNHACDGNCPYTDIERLKEKLISNGEILQWEVKK